jgi:hypothetical protein
MRAAVVDDGDACSNAAARLLGRTHTDAQGHGVQVGETNAPQPDAAPMACASTSDKPRESTATTASNFTRDVSLTIASTIAAVASELKSSRFV